MEKSPAILITGGTGLVGRALSEALLAKGYRVIILSRTSGSPSRQPGLRYAAWDPERQQIEEAAIREADHIIHLAGAGVAEKRWTKKRKEEIRSSRVLSSGLLVKSLREIPNKVQTVVSASAIGWYGEDPVQPNPAPFTETLPNANDFLGHTCRLWEEGIRPVIEQQKRLVTFRIGIVMSPAGGALKEFLRPLRLGVAAILGNGRQTVSWIHLDDLVRLFIAAIEKPSMQGVYNAVAPHPLSNRELVLQLAKSRKRFYIPFRVPAFLLRLLLGEMSIEILKSATVSSEKIRQTGFSFTYKTFQDAAGSWNR